MVVTQRLHNRFANRFEGSEMNHGVDFLRAHQLSQSFGIEHIHFDQRGPNAGDALNPFNHLR